MKSNNPVFNNSPAFNGQGANAYGNTTYPGAGASYPGYGQSDPSTWGTGSPAAPTTGIERPLTIDDVVQKTGLTLAVVVLVAAGLWIGTGDLNTSADLGPLLALTTVGMIGGLIIGLVASFSRKMLSPALVLAYAVAEGLFMGGISKVYQAQSNGSPIVMQAVLGTVCAAGGMLAAYKFFDIKISDKFRRGFIAAAFGFLGLALLEVVLGFFGAGFGLFGNGGAGFVFALAGLAFGVVGLLLDFDMVENGIRARVPAQFAWTAAFGLTASLVMVYFYLLRLLSILNQD